VGVERTRSRRWLALSLALLFAAIAVPAQARPAAPECVRQATGDLTVMRGKPLRGKRVFFRSRIAGAVLVVDYELLDAAFERALSPQSRADTIKFAQRAQQRLRAAIANTVELNGREVITEDPHADLDRFLALVVEDGGFEVRERGKATRTLYRLEWRWTGEGGRGAGRRFLVANCKVLLSVTDEFAVR
jgi:hypothetical protein